MLANIFHQDSFVWKWFTSKHAHTHFSTCIEREHTIRSVLLQSPPLFRDTLGKGSSCHGNPGSLGTSLSAGLRCYITLRGEELASGVGTFNVAPPRLCLLGPCKKNQHKTLRGWEEDYEWQWGERAERLTGWGWVHMQLREKHWIIWRTTQPCFLLLCHGPF